MVTETPMPTELAAAAALASPTRRRVASLLQSAPDGLGVTKIARELELHPNTVRAHLRALAEAGVVAAAPTAPAGRGRPGMLFRLLDPTLPRLAAHQELVRVLVDLVVRCGVGREGIERAGVGHGRRLASPGGRDALLDAFARLGFAPQVVSSAAELAQGRLTLCLRHCPFAEAVLQPGGGAICALHRGMSAGMAEVAAPGARLTRLESRDPREACCRVEYEGAHPDT